MMGKIKLNLVSGAVVEKPLINAFKANNNSYVVLDNEMNGSMGLPIILVCKFIDNKLTKIVDQNEWQIVKEYLKNIIAGNQVEFIKVNSEIVADDIYYTQLTLPAPSFDALKNAYKVEEDSTSNNISETSVMDINPEPIESIINIADPVQQEVNTTPQFETPVINNEPVINITPVQEIVEPSVEINSTPVIEPVVNTINPTEIVSEPVVEPEINVATDVNIDSVQEETNIFKEQKEAFMQACENMFDALVQKFEKELENRK